MSPGKLLGPDDFYCFISGSVLVNWPAPHLPNTNFKLSLFTDRTFTHSLFTHKFNIPFPHQGSRPYVKLLVKALGERDY
jgi:hypothetical protein